MLINGILHLSPKESFEVVGAGAIIVDVRPEALTWITDWEHDGLPLLKDKGRELNGPCLCMLRPKKK